MADTQVSTEVPDCLGEAGQALWTEVTGEWTLRTDELVLLLEACRTKDELERLNEAIDQHPLLTTGAQGQERVHPLFTEIRAHRLALRQLFLFLGLGGVDENSAEARSAHGRSLARARWSNRG